MSRRGPRRLTNSILMPPGAGRSASRSGAGEESWAAAIGRSRKNRVSPHWAARCRRRSDSLRMCCCHSSTAPQLPLRRICSAAHRLSAALPVLRIHSSCCWGNSRPRVCGSNGGWSRATGSFWLASDDCNNRNSPMPGCWSSNSVKAPAGQPPPGNWWERTGIPVSTQDVAPLESWEASQRAGCKGCGSKSAIAANTGYAYSIILCARGENLFQSLRVQHSFTPLGKLLRSGFGETLPDR